MRAFKFLIILFVLTGCLKRNESHVNVPCTDSCMTINVRVTTGLNSVTPIVNAPVELGWSRPATPLGDPGRLIARGKTSGDGSISFSFKARAKELQGGKFYVRSNKSREYFFQQNSYYGIKKYDSVVTANVHVPGKATLTIVYKNFNPISSDDFFQCVPFFSTYGSDPIPVEMNRTNGQSSNTHFFKSDSAFTRLELKGTTAGDQYTYFSIIKKKNGERIDLRDSIYIGKGQTKTYEVDFN